MHSLSEILGVGILTHACEKRLNSAQNLPFGGKSSGCRKGDACPGNVVWEASPSHLQGAGVGGELRVAPVDLPRITRAAMSLSPVGVVGPVWGCRGKQVNSRGFLEWDPHCGLTGVPVTCWGCPPLLCGGWTPEGEAPACRLRAARRRVGPGSQDSRFSPLRPLPGSARTSLASVSSSVQ